MEPLNDRQYTECNSFWHFNGAKIHINTHTQQAKIETVKTKKSRLNSRNILEIAKHRIQQPIRKKNRQQERENGMSIHEN